MYVPFENLPDTARIWIYQSDRQFTALEKDTISSTLITFTKQWTAHNQTLGASFAVLYDRFIVLAVDENINQASGCSIDGSVRAIRNLEGSLNVDLFNRLNVAFLKDEDVQIVPSAILSAKLDEGIWNGSSIVFDNTIRTKAELNSSWKVPAGSSWLKRYLTKASV